MNSLRRIVGTTIWLSVLLALVGTSQAQTYQEGKILKWDTEPYSQSAHIVRNAVVYYIQVDKTIYQITRRRLKPDENLIAGQNVQCRVEKNYMFIPGEKSKEMKYTILGASSAAE